MLNSCACRNAKLYKWPKIDYSRYPTTKRLTNSDVDAEIKKALDVWSEYTDLNFEMKTTGQVRKS